MIQYIGLWFLIALTLNMWAWLCVTRSGARPTSLLIWTVVLFCLPVVGFLIWFMIGPRDARA